MPADDPRSTADREIVLSLTVDAPRARVWRAWTEPEHIRQWWGPDGFTTTIHEMRVEVGGVWRFTMHAADGTDFPNRIDYLQIVPGVRLVVDHSDDQPVPASKFQTVVTFEDASGGTRVVQRGIFATPAARAAVLAFGADELGRQGLRRLARHVATMRD